MNNGNTESHAEPRSSRRETNPPTSALSAAPREKKSCWKTKKFGNGVSERKRGFGTVSDFGCTSSLCPELSKGLRNLNGLLPRN
jgi:hypothetical protein